MAINFNSIKNIKRLPLYEIGSSRFIIKQSFPVRSLGQDVSMTLVYNIICCVMPKNLSTEASIDISLLLMLTDEVHTTNLKQFIFLH